MNKLKSTILFSTLLVVMFLCTNQANAQFDPKVNNTKMLTLGTGFSAWGGLPLFLRFEVPVANNITAGGNFSYQSNNQNWNTIGYKESVIGISGRASYHFNEIFEASSEWDFYAGASLGFFIWNYTYSDPNITYSQSKSNGLGLGGHLGVRYFINEKIGINLEGGHGSVLSSSGTIGVTFLL